MRGGELLLVGVGQFVQRYRQAVFQLLLPYSEQKHNIILIVECALKVIVFGTCDDMYDYRRECVFVSVV